MRSPALLFALLIPTLALAAPENQGYYMQPSLRGDNLVFVSQGDLWLVSANGGVAHALTSHVAPVNAPAISPDGSQVAFTGSYEGPNDVYLMPLQGGQPKRLTYAGSTLVNGW